MQLQNVASESVRARGLRVTVRGLTKSYGSLKALDDLTIDVEPGSFQALLGPSGSGKTSLLMSVAGFLKPDAGTIDVEGRDVTHLPPEKRNFGMVFQGYALFPHMTVIDNVGFALRARGVPLKERRRRAGEAIELVQLGGLSERYPSQLSGGQQQRVALARAIAFQPELLLLDEPLSALDRALRSQLQGELRDLQQKTGLTCLYVTHDQDEALSMADKVAVLTEGKIVQQGAPDELYERPATRFVAHFLGKNNELPVVVECKRGNHVVCHRGETIVHHNGGENCVPGDTIHLALRPERLVLCGKGTKTDALANRIKATVRSASYLGNAVEFVADSKEFGALTARVPATERARIVIGSEVELAWSADATARIADV